MRLNILLITAAVSGCVGQLALACNDIVNSRPAAAFVDVTVVPMDSERVLEHQTIVVRDGRIAEIHCCGRALS